MIHPSRRRPSSAAVIAALLIVYVVWGSTYFAIAVMIETLPPLLAAGVRYAAAGVLMLGALAALTIAWLAVWLWARGPAELEWA